MRIEQGINMNGNRPRDVATMWAGENSMSMSAMTYPWISMLRRVS